MKVEDDTKIVAMAKVIKEEDDDGDEKTKEKKKSRSEDNGEQLTL